MGNREFSIEDIIEERVYTAQAAANTLGVALLTIYRWIESGRLPSENPGGHHRIRGSDLIHFLTTRPKRSNVKPVKIEVQDESEKRFETWLHKAKLNGELRLLPKAILDIIDERIYNTSQVADLIGVGRATVSLWISSGKLKSLKPTGHHAILGSDLKQFLFERYTNKANTN